MKRKRRVGTTAVKTRLRKASKASGMKNCHTLLYVNCDAFKEPFSSQKKTSDLLAQELSHLVKTGESLFEEALNLIIDERKHGLANGEVLHDVMAHMYREKSANIPADSVKGRYGLLTSFGAKKLMFACRTQLPVVSIGQVLTIVAVKDEVTWGNMSIQERKDVINDNKMHGDVVDSMLFVRTDYNIVTELSQLVENPTDQNIDKCELLPHAQWSILHENLVSLLMDYKKYHASIASTDPNVFTPNIHEMMKFYSKDFP